MDLSELADRLEAAAKRDECSGNAAKPALVGNTAAMREALEVMNSIDTRGLKRLLWVLVEADIFDGGQINKTISAVEKARRALSAPPRNCDRFKTREEARAYFDNIVCQRSNGSGSIECKGCHLDSIDNPHRADCREEWLFAPAAERKGECDGSK